MSCHCVDGGKNGGSKKLLTLDNINQRVVNMQYLVRGYLVTRAIEIQKELDEVKLHSYLLIFYLTNYHLSNIFTKITEIS